MRHLLPVILALLAGCAPVRTLAPLPDDGEGYRAIRFTQNVTIRGPLNVPYRFTRGTVWPAYEERLSSGAPVYCGSILSGAAAQPVCIVFTGDNRIDWFAWNITTPVAIVMSDELPPGSFEIIRLR